jgi:hypothetical protein
LQVRQAHPAHQELQVHPEWLDHQERPVPAVTKGQAAHQDQVVSQDQSELLAPPEKRDRQEWLAHQESPDHQERQVQVATKAHQEHQVPVV